MRNLFRETNTIPLTQKEQQVTSWTCLRAHKTYHRQTSKRWQTNSLTPWVSWPSTLVPLDPTATRGEAELTKRVLFKRRQKTFRGTTSRWPNYSIEPPATWNSSSKPTQEAEPLGDWKSPPNWWWFGTMTKTSRLNGLSLAERESFS